MEKCFTQIKKTIKNRSKACANLNANQLLNAFQNTPTDNTVITNCSKAINKYKKRIVCCGASLSLRENKKIKHLAKLYQINNIFKNNFS